ncbi:DUF2304 domain-containing protein [Knoellia sp. p5-6-4]|uniref:DUF2304 domain-containing protein n=1 Tax=unclassified Knoellia TaxID=2618719 RepID=UPI0023DB1EC7|nr:DUF2304 domain-containing protein [Knoellia sp. p5-6-4]MDF2146425.1 DUF2304 domain-containing protein [Knoellia sp. p5-6-4]
MTNDAYWLGVAGGVLIVAVVVEMVRRRYLRGRYAVVWVVLGAGAAILALFPDLLGRVANALGVVVPLNLLLFLGMLVMLVMIMQLSSETGRLRERTRILAEEVALMRAEADGRAAEGHPAASLDVVWADGP